MKKLERTEGEGKELHFSDGEAAASSSAGEIATVLQEAIRERGHASFLVSGGSSPVRVFQLLSAKALDWAKVSISLVDERWVDPSHDMSNESLVRKHLLINHARDAHFIPMVNDADTPEAGAAKLTESLQSISRPFDAVMLGMGEDGHTASLFPCSDELERGLDLDSGLICLAVHPKTAPLPRMSLSLPALLDSKRLFLLLNGQSKQDVYRKACAESSTSSIREMPIRAFIHQSSIPLDVYLS